MPFCGLPNVTFPLSMPGEVAGTLLTFIPAAGALSVTIMVIIVAAVMVYIRTAGTEELV
jgi:spermidine/putrescine transport system permease protein